ncbi:hypothetical protein [Streptomyces sp. NPDC091212]|uniref:hypothetical protein n=1 Tax=Streptomyces sp. NPDC091212 TaxID=3155191 RepID=UPI00341603E5
MQVEEGHFYRSAGGDIWQAVSQSIVQFAANGDGDPDVIPFDVMPADKVNDVSGPLVEVRPMGWEEV